MSITHHPSDATLAAFAAGTLHEGRMLVVSVHLAGCAQCRNAARQFQCVGGAMLDDTAPEAMSPDALQRVRERMAGVESAIRTRAKAQSDLPAPLSSYRMGEWRRIGIGVSYRSVDVPAQDGTRVFMLKAAPGTQLPHHAHTGTEWTCILQGAFRHAGGRFGPGDFDEADDAVEHIPVIEDGEECICLVALSGQVQFKSLIGRLIQPFVRM